MGGCLSSALLIGKAVIHTSSYLYIFFYHHLAPTFPLLAGMGRLHTKQQVLIPPRFRDEIMQHFHKSYGGLHQAARRIYKTMSEYVTWFGVGEGRVNSWRHGEAT